MEAVSEGLEVVTLLVDGNDLLVRLFHARDQGGEGVVRLGVKPEGVELVELDGKPRAPRDGELIASTSDDGRALLRLSLPPFGLRTLRLRGVARTPGTA